MNFSKRNLTKSSLPIGELLFVNIKESILGRDYEISLVCVGDRRAQKMNLKYRQKSYIPNILSFPLDNKTGEIFLNLKQIKKETKKFKLSYKNLIILMYIHGCLHLKGLKHGSKMQGLEQRYLDEFTK